MKEGNPAKRAAALAALDLIKNGMFVGLGTGSTAEVFIKELAQKNLDIKCMATSKASEALAKQVGLTLIETETLDITVDGADEIDPQLRMIKGGGGALLREKIIASISKQVIAIVDESKVVEHLGRFPLPIEVVPFAEKIIQNKIKTLGYPSRLRSDNDKPFITDNGNHILDISLSHPCLDPESLDQQIRELPGVVETGFFLKLATIAIIGSSDGSVKFLP